jgi:hypothetical protein
MPDDMNAKTVAAMEDIARVVGEWTLDVGDAVTRNLASVKAQGVKAGDLAAWSIQAVELLIDGAVRTSAALLDGAGQFGSTGAEEAPRQDLPVVRAVNVTSTSARAIPLGLALKGQRTGTVVSSAKVALNPPSVKQGTTKVEVSVNLSGLVDDIYIGQVVGRLGRVKVQPQTLAFAHRIV